MQSKLIVKKKCVGASVVAAANNDSACVFVCALLFAFRATFSIQSILADFLYSCGHMWLYYMYT